MKLRENQRAILAHMAAHSGRWDADLWIRNRTTTVRVLESLRRVGLVAKVPGRYYITPAGFQAARDAGLVILPDLDAGAWAGRFPRGAR